MNINWTKFDKIYCVQYLPYEEKNNVLKNELQRVEILNAQNFDFYYIDKSIAYDYLYESMLTHEIIFNNKNIKYNFIDNKIFNLTMNNLNLLKICDYNEYENVLFLTDDVMFIKELDLIKKYIDNLPNDYLMINFDIKAKTENLYNQVSQINNFYLETNFNNESFFSTSCYALNKKMIKRIIHEQETILKSIDCYLNNSNICLGLDYRLVIPKQRLCI